MQTLNVGAGRTDQEYKEAEEQRRADLRGESQVAANLFFWAAGFAALGTGLLPIRLGIIVSIGVIDLLSFYGRPLGHLYGVVIYAISATWVAGLVVLGLVARRGHRWPFLAGMILYGCDMIALLTTFSLWAFGLHSFFVFKWFQGQSALRQAEEEIVSMDGQSESTL